MLEQVKRVDPQGAYRDAPRREPHPRTPPPPREPETAPDAAPASRPSHDAVRLMAERLEALQRGLTGPAEGDRETLARSLAEARVAMANLMGASPDGTPPAETDLAVLTRRLAQAPVPPERVLALLGDREKPRS